MKVFEKKTLILLVFLDDYFKNRLDLLAYVF